MAKVLGTFSCVELQPHETNFYLYAQNVDGPSWNKLIENIYNYCWAPFGNEEQGLRTAKEMIKDYLAGIFFTYVCYHVENKRAFFRCKNEVLDHVSSVILSDEFTEFELGNIPA